MFGILVLLFLVVPVVELYIIVQVASGIGVLETLGLLILVSIVGAWMVRAQGLGALRRVQSQLANGQVPGRELVDGFLILFAGALMLTPGFLTDAFGLLLLIPPTRAIVRTIIVHRFRDRVVVGGPRVTFGSGPGPGAGRFGGGGVTDVNEVDPDGPSTDDDPPAPPAIGLGPGRRRGLRLRCLAGHQVTQLGSAERRGEQVALRVATAEHLDCG